LTGVPLNSLLADAYVLAGEAGGEFIVVEGSGGAVPPAAGATCFLVNVRAEPEILRTFPFAYQLRKADAVITTGFSGKPPAKPFEELKAEVEAAKAGAAFYYARLVAAPAGKPAFKNAVVVTARPESEREELAGHWRREVNVNVRQVVGTGEFPPKAATVKWLPEGDSDAGLLLDMAAPNLAEWLAWAASRRVPLLPTYEVLAPEAAIHETLVKAAVKAAR
jgi:predicted GTPase